MKTNSRHSKQEILDLYRAVSAKFGETPGLGRFCSEAGLKRSEIMYYWASPAQLTKEAGFKPNEYTERLQDEAVFNDYAKVCLDLGKIPSSRQLRITQRELKTRTHTVYNRDGSIQAFQKRFQTWLATQPDGLKIILEFTGWAVDKEEISLTDTDTLKPVPQLHPFLPACIQYLDVIARGEAPPFNSAEMSISTLFERRTSDAFRCLGFEMKQFGQGTGRNADALACAPRERTALIIDAKVRTNGYVLGTEDRKILEYSKTHGNELQKQGFEKLYFVVVGTTFRDSDLQKLGESLSESHSEVLP